MKRLNIVLAGVIAMSLTACLKDKPNNDFTGLQPIAEMPYSGKGFFSSDAITDLSDTVTVSFTVNIASAYPLSKGTTITVAPDLSQVAAYNAYDTSVTYEAVPSDAYSFDPTTFTIPAGSRLDTLQVTFYRNKLDPTKSYMLPIAITDASGLTISGNMGIHYYHFIGNPIAGLYSWDYSRWNTSAPSGAPSGWVGDEAVFSPATPTEVTIPTGYGSSVGYPTLQYDLSFTNTDGVLSDFKLKLNGVADINAGGISLTDGPKIIQADPVAGVYEFTFQVFNGTAYRYFDEKFYK